jgi:hypothetical protein
VLAGRRVRIGARLLLAGRRVRVGARFVLAGPGNPPRPGVPPGARSLLIGGPRRGGGQDRFGQVPFLSGGAARAERLTGSEEPFEG